MSNGLTFRDPTKIPDNIRRLLPKEEQARLGYKPAPTATEMAAEQDQRAAAQDFKDEETLQKQIYAYLWGQLDIEVIVPPFRKKSQLPEGWPDFTFSYYGRSVALEAKTKTGKVEPHQAERHQKMRAAPNCWTVEVVRSLDDVRAVLQRIRQDVKP